MSAGCRTSSASCRRRREMPDGRLSAGTSRLCRLLAVIFVATAVLPVVFSSQRLGLCERHNSRRCFLKSQWLATIGVTALLIMSASAASAQRHTQFDDKDRQTTNDWYNQHKDHPPVGLRRQDRLSADQESRLREGSTLDKDLRKRVHLDSPPGPQASSPRPEQPSLRRHWWTCRAD